MQQVISKVPDWSSWRVSLAKIDVGEIENDDGGLYYVPTITVFLGDDLEGKNVFSITTDYMYDNINTAIVNAAKNISNMFDNISANVLHFNAKGDIIGEYDLNDEVENMLATKTNRILH
jgi:hypothetical protein